MMLSYQEMGVSSVYHRLFGMIRIYPMGKCGSVPFTFKYFGRWYYILLGHVSILCLFFGSEGTPFWAYFIGRIQHMFFMFFGMKFSSHKTYLHHVGEMMPKFRILFILITI